MSTVHRPPRDVPAEVAVDERLVRRLLRTQHPDLADESIQPFAEGWDNAMFRLGSSRLVRLPRRRLGGEAIEREQKWLPRLAPSLPLAVPVAERTGSPEPGGYPYRWSVLPHFEGTELGASDDVDVAAVARELGTFLRCLHALPAPVDGPRNPHRGVALATRNERFREVYVTAAARFDAARTTRVWETACAAEPWSDSPRWCHGDFHPFNVLVASGRPAAVIDWGDLCVGDPATDMAGAWMSLAEPERATFHECYGDVDDATLCRALGWALYFGATFVHAADAGAGNAFRRVGMRTIEHVLDAGTRVQATP